MIASVSPNIANARARSAGRRRGHADGAATRLRTIAVYSELDLCAAAHVPRDGHAAVVCSWLAATSRTAVRAPGTRSWQPPGHSAAWTAIPSDCGCPSGSFARFIERCPWAEGQAWRLGSRPASRRLFRRHGAPKGSRQAARMMQDRQRPTA